MNELRIYLLTWVYRRRFYEIHDEFWREQMLSASEGGTNLIREFFTDLYEKYRDRVYARAKRRSVENLALGAEKMGRQTMKFGR